MEFNEHKPIYLQIAETLCDKIVLGEWEPEERIPSVREMGAVLGVNPNTVARTYDYLQQLDIIYNKRGIGYFVTLNAKNLILTHEKKIFIDTELPALFKKMNGLGISIDQIGDYYKNFIEKEKTL